MDDVLSTRLDLLEGRLTFWQKREAELEARYVTQLARLRQQMFWLLYACFLLSVGLTLVLAHFFWKLPP
jgi:hypothetical protein